MSLLTILILLGWSPTPAQAQNISQQTVEYNISTAPLILNMYAVSYGIDFDEFLATAKCESKLQADAVGDKGTSFGIFQIHLPAHRGVTKAQALDPWFAAEWAANEFSKGNANIWSCYRILYPRGGNSG